MTATITLSLNGKSVAADAEPRTHLADFLRETHLLTGTHIGCEQGVCGACTIFVDGRPVRSCITLAVSCEGAEVRTVEGFDDDPLMAALRAAFRSHHALQCGFCTPGMLATAYDIARRLPDADRTRIRQELSGNLCRCTGYQGIVEAIASVLEAGPPAAPLRPGPRVRTRPGLSGGASAAIASKSSKSAKAEAARAGFEEYAAPETLKGASVLTRTLPVDAPADVVWAMLKDLPTLTRCIPGAVLDSPPEDDAFAGHFEVALGPMTARFGGAGAMRLDEDARRGTVRGRGRDPLSRSTLDGALDFALEPAGRNTSRLSFTAHYLLKGPFAQFGRPALVEAAADRILSETADNIAARAHGVIPDTNGARRMSGFGLLLAMLRGGLSRLLRSR